MDSLVRKKLREVLAGINAEKTPSAEDPRHKLEVLQQDLEAMGQADRDWDESHSNVNTRRNTVIWFIFLLITGALAYYLGMQNSTPKTAKAVSDKTRFVISSEPSGATVSVSGVRWGVTPLDMEQEVLDPFMTIHVSKPGFQANRFRLIQKQGQSCMSKLTFLKNPLESALSNVKLSS